eukprot:scaffold72584_cov18-Prasinocladus_malaysianus.AAC.1
MVQELLRAFKRPGETALGSSPGAGLYLRAFPLAKRTDRAQGLISWSTYANKRRCDNKPKIDTNRA